MKLNYIFLLVFNTIVLLCITKSTNGLLRRCFQCRSRGELGSCKDPFTWNVTQVENEPGVEAVPCASGWCGKILETENALKEEYGIATQRMCLQRGPSDGEDRCAYTLWNRKKVYMCFCQGDICNNAPRSATSVYLMSLCIFILSLFKYIISR